MRHHSRKIMHAVKKRKRSMILTAHFHSMFHSNIHTKIKKDWKTPSCDRNKHHFCYSLDPLSPSFFQSPHALLLRGLICPSKQKKNQKQSILSKKSERLADLVLCRW